MNTIIAIEVVVLISFVFFAVYAAKKFFNQTPAPKKRRNSVEVDGFQWEAPLLDENKEPYWAPTPISVEVDGFQWEAPSLDENEATSTQENPITILCQWRERANFQSKDWNRQMKNKFQESVIYYDGKLSKEQIKQYYQLDRYTI